MARPPRKSGQPIRLTTADRPRLEGNLDGERWGAFALKKRTTLGRHPNNDLCLEDREVSKFHCQIEIVGQEVRIKDLGSANGTWVNGRKVREERLYDGDELVLGTLHLQVRLGDLDASVRPPSNEAQALANDHVFLFQFAKLDQLMEQGERKMKVLRDKEKALETQLSAAVGVGELALLRASHEKMRTASDFHQGLGLEPNAEAVPTLLVRVVRQMLDADHVVLLLVDGQGRWVRRSASRRDEALEELPISDAVLQRVKTERATVLSGNVGVDSRFSASHSAGAFGIRSVLAVPLLVRGALRGVLHCDTRQRQDAFTDSDARIIAGLVSHAALALEVGRDR